MCFMMLTHFVNVRVHVNTGAKGNLVTAERERDLNHILQMFPSLFDIMENLYACDIACDIARDCSCCKRLQASASIKCALKP